MWEWDGRGLRIHSRVTLYSEAMLQASLDDVDWDMFWANSSDVSEFTDVALSFVNMLTEQVTETVTIRTFSNQKPWVDRTIRDVVNHRTDVAYFVRIAYRKLSFIAGSVDVAYFVKTAYQCL